MPTHGSTTDQISESTSISREMAIRMKNEGEEDLLFSQATQSSVINKVPHLQGKSTKTLSFGTLAIY